MLASELPCLFGTVSEHFMVPKPRPAGRTNNHKPAFKVCMLVVRVAVARPPAIGSSRGQNLKSLPQWPKGSGRGYAAKLTQVGSEGPNPYVQ